MAAVWSLRAGVGDIPETVDAMADALRAREPPAEYAHIGEAMVELDIELMAVTAAAIGANPVIERIICGRADSHVGQREIPHHLKRHRVDQVTGTSRRNVRRPQQFGIAGAHVSDQIIEGDVRTANGPAGTAAVSARVRVPELAAGRRALPGRVERSAGVRAQFAEIAGTLECAGHTCTGGALAARDC